MFPLASVEKYLTALVIGHLIAEHKLSFNTKLAKFFPKIDHSKDISIRQLLDHRSGIQMDELTPDQTLTSGAGYFGLDIRADGIDWRPQLHLC